MAGVSNDGENRSPGLRRKLRFFLADEAGSTAMEYGLLAAILALMLVGFLQSFADKLSGFFLSLAGAIRTS